MKDECKSCGEAMTSGGLMKGPNTRHSDAVLAFVNIANGTSNSELCKICGEEPISLATSEVKKFQKTFKDNIGNFPMMTVEYLPPAIRYRLKGMLTANVTVGTGLFNEFSQGFSDFFGATNTQSGMAHKTNSGETVARGILVNRALAAGANCIIGVDIDYGVTATNAATVNMQGTAIIVENIADVLDEADNARAVELTATFTPLAQLTKAWRHAFPYSPLD